VLGIATMTIRVDKHGLFIAENIVIPFPSNAAALQMSPLLLHKLTVTVMLLLSTIKAGGKSLQRTSTSERY
jgi:hypothetical protein